MPRRLPAGATDRLRGFTLIEIVIGLAVAGLVAVSAARGVGTLRALERDMRSRADEAATWTARRAAVSDWIGTTIAASMDEPFRLRLIDGARDSLPDDEVYLPSIWRSGAGPARAWVRLFIDRDSATTEEGLVAHIWMNEFSPSLGHGASGSDATAPEMAPATVRLELVPEARGLDFRALTVVDGGPAWVSRWASLEQLPYAIEMRIEGDSVPVAYRTPWLVALAPIPRW